MGRDLPRRAVVRRWHGEFRWWLSDPLLKPVQRFAAAIIVAAGPWLVSVFALAIISVTMTPAMGLAAVEDFRLTVVYAFCIAPLATGPIGAIAARRVVVEVQAGNHARVPELFIAAGACSALVAQIIAVLACLLLGVRPIGVATGLVSLTAAAALLWTSFAILSAVSAYGFLIAALTGGMVFSVLCTLVAASITPTTEMLIWCFIAGVLFCVTLCLRHVQLHFPSRYDAFLPTAQGLLADLRGNAVLCAGVLFAICGVWIDKWTFWFGPHSVRSEAGLLHYSLYDSVMFLAHLSVIPSYAALLVFHHGDLVAATERFKAALAARATHGVIRARIDDLERTVWSGMFTIAFVQGAITAGLILMAPLMARFLDFSFNQFLMLRIALIGVCLHGVMFLCCAMLLVANRTRHFMLIQAGFLVLNLTMSLLFYAFVGISAYAFFISSLLGALAAFYCAYRAIHDYDYLTLLGENDSLYTQ
ncbi:exopolysaccharide Pel transporter PelG [Paracoccus sp. MC1862]|uniref:exopolysaccharide Pel transporter PelG n=1 Tax=Paracoccus sp. MC1862 TaxID=2760307 RepID=UPI001600D410|nr:exopolysaccharide Pel transporter PelG [Paracoccus sp. MC1862]QQO43534.1 exopolysaccharide Pel transporter PelG [Paracoccus sp. MC1862]